VHPLRTALRSIAIRSGNDSSIAYGFPRAQNAGHAGGPDYDRNNLRDQDVHCPANEVPVPIQDDIIGFAVDYLAVYAIYIGVMAGAGWFIGSLMLRRSASLRSSL
jgi:hypothetical protein